MLLEKILQSQGFGSRKHCQQLIKNGAVSIDGQVISDVKFKIAEQQLKFQVYSKEYQYREHVYLALNKPQNYECSHQATHHFSVFDLIDELLLNRGVQCIGRLDQDTTGMLLLTDDGQFLQALTHPKKHVPKVYQVETTDPISQAQIEQLLKGVELRNEKGIYTASQVKKLAENKLSLTIHQGVYHQVKRMLAAVGNKVIKLHRQQVGLLDLGQLEEGQYLYLNEQQIQAAKNQSESIQSLE
ncbi:rRNA pseudouridine synthase [Acinetobacter defluvii]|uniref:Ribosomal small subunit pseudouridine synthase A n=1 Tax=Acinetobacter defluvii TaxID=1871111 RepID=A0A2S2FCE2_9GAMM|nr:pseudouridine synthase [Acinetobacter defluvii]AWL28641.1 rRNA pseudouridine synthase [Acinetobacter defluvii]